MRRRTLQQLANLGRLTSLVLALGAGATAWVWVYRPQWVDSLDAWLVKRAHRPYETRLAEALAVQDAATSEDLLEQLVDDMAFVKRQDHLAPTVTQSMQRLSHLREQAGDLANAIEWMADAAAFDDHNLRSLVRLYELRCRNGESQKQGEAEFAALWAQFPGSPWVAPAYANHLAARGDRKALDVIEKSLKAIESNLWTFVWDPGKSPDGKNLPEIGDLERGIRRADIVPTIEDGVLRLRFVVNEPCQRVRFYLPPFASFALLDPRLRVFAPGGTNADVDLAADPGEIGHLRRGSGRIDAFGESSPNLTVALPQRTPGAAMFELTGRFEPTQSTLLLAPLRGPLFAKVEQTLITAKDEDGLRRLRELRGQALSQSMLQVFWRAAAADFTSRDSKPASLGMRVADGVKFAATVPLAVKATALRIDLPEDLGVRYRLDELAVTAGGQRSALDPATVAFLVTHDLERNGAELTVTGPDPYFAFAVPGAPPGSASVLDSVTCAGSIR
jgi:hypothetical protein